MSFWAKYRPISHETSHIQSSITRRHVPTSAFDYFGIPPLYLHHQNVSICGAWNCSMESDCQLSVACIRQIYSQLTSNKVHPWLSTLTTRLSIHPHLVGESVSSIGSICGAQNCSTEAEYQLSRPVRRPVQTPCQTNIIPVPLIMPLGKTQRPSVIIVILEDE